VKPDRLGDDVQRELARFGPAEGMSELVRAWPEAVGDQIARNAWPARLARDRTLHVATSSSAWAFELAQLEPKLRERLEEALGETAPAALRFAPGKLPERSSEELESRTRRGREPTNEERELAAALAAGIEDENLRKVVAKAALASLARAD
jgi:predicted nucleic acid-binding Zn ribbon protein